jgi:hypothetical protein
MSLPGIIKGDGEVSLEAFDLNETSVKTTSAVKKAPPVKEPPPLKPNHCPKCKKLAISDKQLFSYFLAGVKQMHCAWCWESIIKFQYPDSYKAFITEPKTQKARGVYALHKTYGGLVASPVGLVSVKEPLDENANQILKALLPKFVRPCPPSPEHGFVESRVIKTVEEFEVIRQETLTANEDSELMLMDLIDAKSNSIWTPHLLSVGPGHDGATAGKDSVSVPLVGINELSKDLLKSASIGDDQDPYVEAVSNVGSFLTQLRAGPRLSSGLSPDFIPVPTKVTEVIKTNNEDLLEWAKVVKSLAGKPGIVVWHPGGTLTDHYSVHCRCSGVPIVLSFEPKVGDELVGSDEVPPIDPAEVIKGIYVGDNVVLKDDYNAYVLLCLIALHHSAVMRGPHSFWLGVAVSSLLKLGLAAMEAEARHAHQCYAGMKGKPDIYAYYTSRKLSFARARLSRVTQILHYGFGDPSVPKSFGGTKWALCGASLAPLFNAVRDLCASPSEENASKLVGALNIAINQAHNGGWWLNKFADNQAYDEIPKGNVWRTICAAPAILASHQARLTIEQPKLNRMISTISKWPDSEIKPLKWRKAQLEVQPGAFILNLKAATLPVPRSVTIPVTPAMIKGILSKIGEIKIERGKIDLVGPNEKVINLWTEEPLVAEARKVHR